MVAGNALRNGAWGHGRNRSNVENRGIDSERVGGTFPMSKTTKKAWERKRTDETRQIEDLLRKEFQDVDAYRYNSASIRVRVVDPRFKGKSNAARDKMVDRLLS